MQQFLKFSNGNHCLGKGIEILVNIFWGFYGFDTEPVDCLCRTTNTKLT